MALANHSFSQDKFTYFKIEAGYLAGFGSVNYDNRAIFVNYNRANRLRVSYGLYLNTKTTLGIGFGLDGYQSPVYNTAPFFLEVRRFLKANTNSLFAFINLGTTLELGQSFERGFHFSSGIGYLIKKRDINIMPSLGINIQNINNGSAILIDPVSGQIEIIYSKITLSSFAFNLGIQF